MATCNDCIYYPVCNYKMRCDLFKDKTNFVEVVRCKDCKYFEVYYPIKEKDKEPIEAHYCKLYNSDRKQIDFCSYGERKDIK